ncbi:hypothetical protein [Pedobacter sp. SYSU D00535]|uniref:hypothetical protein n=1 Tax=Pedobacter sp. SYSU D00535 TaxID=2810308 RepID=UPI001A97515D|nr:hypothetical protein [Pedobacter sp. SYSU D00535]
MKVLVFRTNVKRQEQVGQIKQLLNPVRSIIDWNFDLEDRDKILRVVTEGLQPKFIESLLLAFGFYCRELED